ncbi:pimeloyl-ACP methyl ester carboxylesterase [Mycolicibacterium sp. BK556]|uniref:alpha/beta hydrolase n=1 Tax=Mycobacteriaceae TaxID=1762 RepID=UPI00105BD99E|nr:MULTISPECIES: alpha/beta hydrolase [Mycobacteriaceae]MBB3603823.1 pimeloyl-ACP methyl ester carboxylesterase [Mycolicibacterium sp. BK556]MBB3634018.1 pimeloyl-ACP methyl ester carboxylesterase [Mycolicibacterium sp. BK607]MBB3751599.1 pimeloyl-ACP methyl ester carboxylesterase [Mycolicibacterium sp. BK634]TDO12114.1 hypothetical protein EV580_3840 [Mycobacterium sp. BK086]
MYFTTETSSNGVIERHFILGEITGVLWSPATEFVDAPLLMAGHSGGMHKQAPGLVASALHSVTRHGFTVVAIDAPGHGDRPRSRQDHRWTEAIRHARAAGEPIAPIVIDYSWSLVQRAVPEWQHTLDALQALPDIGAGKPVGYAGMTLGVVTGLMLATAEPRIRAASFGAVFVDGAAIEAARNVTIPVEYRIPWGHEEFDRAAGIALFDALGSTEKSLHARSGRLYPALDYERENAAQFFVRTLSPATS